MPSSEAMKRAIELLELHYLVVPDSVAARIAAVMDERDAALASEANLRERMEARHRSLLTEQARSQAKGYIAAAYVAQMQAVTIRELLNEEE